MKNTTFKNTLGILLFLGVSFAGNSKNVNLNKDASASLGASAVVNSNVSCNGGSDGSATASATGGIAPYTYLWSDANSQTTALATGLTAGTYTVTITDNITSQATAVVTIIQPSALNPTARITYPSCNGSSGSASVSVSGGTTPYTYAWSSGQTTSSATGLTVAGGPYTVTVTDKHGCSNSSTVVTLTQPTALAVTMNTHVDVSCNGGKGSATANTATGGTAPYAYAWSPTGGTNLTATGLAAGTYTITAKDHNGCTAIASVTITQPNILAIGLVSRTPATCNGGTGSALANTATGGTTPYSYLWSDADAQTSLNATGLTAGVYTITATDANGCTAVTSANITQPTLLTIAITSQTNVSCDGGSNGSVTARAAIGGSTPYVYAWSPGGATSLTTNGLAANTYTITATDGHGCTATASTSVTQPASLPAVTIASSVNPSCSGSNTGSATVGAASGGTSPYGYAWSPSGGTNLTATGLVVGTYTVTAKDHNGCTATTSVTLTQPTVLAVTMSAPTNITCNGGAGGSATANAASGGTSPYTYLWSDAGAQTNLTATGLTAGAYTITATDNNGCTAKSTVNVTQPAALTEAITSQTNAACNGSTGSIIARTPTGGTSPYTYAWAASGGTNLTANNLTAGTYTITATDNNGCTATAAATITQPAMAVSITIASHTDATCSGGKGTATANTATGGTSPYKYSWAPSGGSNLTATGLAAGTYTITTTDHNGCTGTASVTITQAGGLTISILSHDAILCNGNTTNITANAAVGGTAPYTYAWAPSGGTTIDATGLTAGSYTITATDNHGCTAVASQSVSQPTVLGITMSSHVNVSCNGGTGTATAHAATGGTSPYSYAWSDPDLQTTLTATSLAAGTYTVTATDFNGCTATASATITQPALALSIAMNTHLDISCYGGTGSATANAAVGGTAPYTYSWAPSGGAGVHATGLVAGTYTITVKDNHGCTAFATVTITQPTRLTITMNSRTGLTCNSDGSGSATANGAAGGTVAYSYMWSDAGSQTNLTATGLSAGTYTITATDNNGCTAAATATISQPTALTLSIASVTNVLCNGGSTGIATARASTGGTSPYTYSWSTGGTSLSINSLAAGVYTITSTDGHGCSATSAATITQPASAVTSSLASSTDPGCYGGKGSATISPSGGTAPYVYTWVPNDGNQATLTNLAAGNYSVTVKDKNGCAASAVTFTITQPLQVRDSIVSSGCNAEGGTALIGTKYGSAPYTYAWTPGGETGSTVTSLSNGTYTVTITDNDGCVGNSIRTTVNCDEHGSESQYNGTDWSSMKFTKLYLYPNPNQGGFNVNGLTTGQTIQIYDYTGRLVQTVKAIDTYMQLDISNESDGMYLLRILNTDGTVATEKKIVKAR